MAYTDVTEQQVAGPYIPESASTKLTTLTWTAVDIANGNRIIMGSGETLLLFKNDDAGAVTITVNSSPDAYGRTATITTFSIAAGVTVGRKFRSRGWEQTAGGRDLVILGSDADLKVMAIRL